MPAIRNGVLRLPPRPAATTRPKPRCIQPRVTPAQTRHKSSRPRVHYLERMHRVLVTLGPPSDVCPIHDLLQRSKGLRPVAHLFEALDALSSEGQHQRPRRRSRHKRPLGLQEIPKKPARGVPGEEVRRPPTQGLVAAGRLGRAPACTLTHRRRRPRGGGEGLNGPAGRGARRRPATIHRGRLPVPAAASRPGEPIRILPRARRSPPGRTRVAVPSPLIPVRVGHRANRTKPEPP